MTSEYRSALLAAALSALSFAAEAKPTIAWQAPSAGGTLTGNVQGPPSCVVTGSDIDRVMFYINGVWTNTDGNLTNGLGCWIDTTKYADGAYTLKAVAYNARGQTATASRNIVIQNPPALSCQTPAEGGKLSGNVQGPPNCVVNGANIARVMFYLDGVWTNTDGNLDNGLGCWIDTTQVANGAHTLTAVAYNAAGETATAQRAIFSQNSAAPQAAIDAADVLGEAQAGTAFAQQSGYNAQVLGIYPYVSAIPEAGIHGTVLSNGETLRLGKETDPLDSTRKALTFQLAPADPLTSKSRRAEITFPPNVEMNKVYWVALSAYVHDWGTLASSDAALFGTQLHSGDNSRGLSPSFGIYTSGGRQFRIESRYSADASPSQANSITTRHGYHDIPFGRWVDFVFKFKQSTTGDGFLQVWQDGVQIVNHQGSLGFNTPGYKDYIKFGYYNWSSFSSSRKVLLRSPVIVADPTGSKYTAEGLRAYVQSK